MGDDAFKNLFGENSDFSDLFNNMFGENSGLFGKKREPKSKEDIKKQGLIDTFRKEVKNGDRSFLEKVVVEYKQEVYSCRDETLYKAHAVACIYAEKLNLAYQSLNMLPELTADQKEAIGLVACQMERYEDVIKCIRRNPKTNVARMAYSISLYKCGHTDPGTHRDILEPLVESHSVANTIIGTMHYNNGDLEIAEKYFRKAAELSPGSENARINLLRAKYANGKKDEVYQEINSFYIETGSNITAEKLDEELNKAEMELPSFRFSGDLSAVVGSLIK